MATVMTSHRTVEAPPLPSRNNNNNNSRPVQRSQTSVNANARPGAGHLQGRSQSTDTPPQNHHVGGSPRHGSGDGNKAPPPLPSRGTSVDSPQQPPSIRRQSFETKSFVNRHTARAYYEPANQSEKAQPPVPPPLRTLPTRNHGNENRINDVYDADDPYGHRQNSQPTSYSHQASDQNIHSPPGRPPKSNSSSALDFERRFAFHDVSDFPDPEPIEHFKKTFPSFSSSVRTKDHQVPRPKNQLGYL